MAKTFTVTLTDEQELALIERKVDIEAFVAKEIKRVHVEALKIRVNTALAAASSVDALTESDAEITKSVDAINAIVKSKPAPIAVPVIT